jgi:AraC-like DNA-binding protein/mannose-6-phosphate isomerase-like protein (cupin superfamily)
MSRILELKRQTLFLSHHACRSIAFNDAVIEWVDIVFEDSGPIPYCPAHSHDWFEFNYVVQGSMATSFGDGPMQTIPAGSFILIPPGVEHAHRYETASPHEGLCLRWRLKKSDRQKAPSDEISLYERLLRLKLWKPQPLADEYGLAALLERLLTESETGEQAIIVQMTFVNVLLLLAGLAASASAAPTIRSAERSAGDGLARKVDIFLNDLQDRELDAKKLADSLHLSYAHVAREFKRRTGQTIVERMTDIRLNKAVEYLLHTELPVKAIAEKSGFASVYYFSRVFKARMGMSPSQYRASAAKGISAARLQGAGET